MVDTDKFIDDLVVPEMRAIATVVHAMEPRADRQYADEVAAHIGDHVVKAFGYLVGWDVKKANEHYRIADMLSKQFRGAKLSRPLRKKLLETYIDRAVPVLERLLAEAEIALERGEIGPVFERLGAVRGIDIRETAYSVLLGQARGVVIDYSDPDMVGRKIQLTTYAYPESAAELVDEKNNLIRACVDPAHRRKVLLDWANSASMRAGNKITGDVWRIYSEARRTAEVAGIELGRVPEPLSTLVWTEAHLPQNPFREGGERALGFSSEGIYDLDEKERPRD